MGEPTYYKVLGEDGETIYGGSAQWSLPTLNEETGEWGPGAWMPPIELGLEPSRKGYHMTDLASLRQWLGPTIYEGEYKGQLIVHNNRVEAGSARLIKRAVWNERTARLFAVDCVEHVLAAMKFKLRDALKIREVLSVCRRYANSQVTQSELDAVAAVALDMAFGPARGAVAIAWGAAWGAARGIANEGAMTAAYGAVAAVAYGASEPIKRAEIEWQGARLLAYLNGEIK